MNKFYTLPMVLLLLTACWPTNVVAQRRGGRGNQPVAGRDLSQAERQDLSSMREEEKLARDVYLAMNDKWGERVFSKISQAESQHMAAIANLLSRYRIADPVIDNTPGKFTATRYQELYRTLVEAGSNSLTDALKVGLKIEEMDIADLRVAIGRTDDQNIIRVFENLERGSRNHLRAFARQLRAAGGSYEATELRQSDFDRIANSETERGGGGQGHEGMRGRGKGSGNGSGKGKGRGKGRGNRR